MQSSDEGRRHTPIIECAFETNNDQNHVTLLFFRGHLFYVSWGCRYDNQCSKAITAMKAHFGKARSNGQEIVPADDGGFREQVMTWRLPQETASMIVGVQFEVMNYDFAPPDEPRQ